METEDLVDELGTDPAPPSLPPGFFAWARAHAWPGNVRELRNAVRRAMYLQRVSHGPAAPVGGAPSGAGAELQIDVTMPFKDAKARVVDAFDRQYVSALLEAHDWNIASAARAAQVDRMSIYKMLQRLGICRTG